jgi:hypothetical protein
MMSYASMELGDEPATGTSPLGSHGPPPTSSYDGLLAWDPDTLAPELVGTHNEVDWLVLFFEFATQTIAHKLRRQLLPNWRSTSHSRSGSRRRSSRQPSSTARSKETKSGSTADAKPASPGSFHRGSANMQSPTDEAVTDGTAATPPTGSASGSNSTTAHGPKMTVRRGASAGRGGILVGKSPPAGDATGSAGAAVEGSHDAKAAAPHAMPSAKSSHDETGAQPHARVMTEEDDQDDDVPAWMTGGVAVGKRLRA